MPPNPPVDHTNASPAMSGAFNLAAWHEQSRCMGSQAVAHQASMRARQSRPIRHDAGRCRPACPLPVSGEPLVHSRRMSGIQRTGRGSVPHETGAFYKAWGCAGAQLYIIRAHQCGGGAPMLSKSSKQVAHCYRRAAECRELAERHENEREFYLERERAWLTLARSFEFSERVGRAINDWQRQKPRNWPATQCISPAPKGPAPKCPACGVEMGLHLFLPMFVEAQKTYEDAFFVCPNCGHLRDYLAAL